MITLLASQEYYEVEQGEQKFIVRKHTLWTEGEESWKVTAEQNGVQLQVEGDKYRELVKLIQNHLVRR